LIPAAYTGLNDKYNMPNCRTLRCYIGNCLRIIMYTIKIIKVGEQLTYNYNEAQKNYPTNDFK